ncbi:MAG: hypothetical protein RIS54_1291 [Verrucomicrobiota bacterium]
MSQGKNILIGVLACTTGVASFWAWRAETRPKAVQLPGAIATSSPVGASSPSVLPSSALAAPSPPVTAPPTAGDSVAATVRENLRARESAMFELRENPEFQRLQQLARQGTLDGRYAELFRQLNLSPEELASFKDLLLEMGSVRADVFMASRKEGLSLRENRDVIRNLIETGEAEVASQIRGLLGDERFAAYEAYNASESYRQVVGRIEQRLSYAATPLTDSQSTRLVSLLTDAHGNLGYTESRSLTPLADRLTGGKGVAIPSTLLITDAIVTQAQGFLAPDQVTALRQIQAELAAGQELARLVREQRAQARQ